ncbi:17-beta-hydroxysteroid dehydrogenase 13-like [Tubulanus polymorphus]|uniref:17-beta-hydroxysteroid dehydrogenase 13-like n=1 Tax=Tubulanus polymorphus TaxID=672921 RepID=UPI003DA58DD5
MNSICDFSFNIVLFLSELIVLFVNCTREFIVFTIRRFFPKQKKSIVGEIALVTGGGHGIGRELCYQIAIEGAFVVVWDIDQLGAEKTVNTIRSRGGKAKYYLVDVTAYEQVVSTSNLVREEIGDVTILVNNAGILHGLDILNLSEKQIRKTFDVNSIALFWTIKAFLPRMIELNRGHVINICSLAAFSGLAYLSDYGSSKFAIRGLHTYLEEEIRLHFKRDIKLSSVFPGFTDTGLVKGMHSRFDRILTTKEVAQVTIEDVLRNEQLIYVPRRMRYILGPIGLIPSKIVSLSLDFSGSRIDLQTDKIGK